MVARRRRHSLGILVAVSCACVGGVAVVAAWRLLRRAVPVSGAMPGLRVDGVELRAGQDVRAFVESRARQILGSRVRLVVQGTDRAVETTFGQVGVSVDVEAAVRRASGIGRGGSWARRLDEIRRAREGRVDVPITLDVSPDRLEAVLRPLKEETDELPVPARFRLPEGTIVPHRSGRYLDLDGSSGAIARAARTLAPEVELPRVSFDPAVSTEMLRGIDLGTVVAKFHTDFSPGGDRGTNIATAASKLRGVVLAPGAVMSFNRVVGPRTIENGFRPGWEIYKGEMVRGIGGGTCQVASTLHAAAFFGGLDVVERYPHSRPSAYIALGLDATVAWPGVDMKLRNPWPFPIVVEAVVRGGRLEIRLLGERRPARVSFRRETLAVVPYPRKVTEASWLSPGRVVKKQKGIRGYRIRRVRKIVLEGGGERIETTEEAYPATPERYLVGPGTDVESELPPLPSDRAADAEAVTAG